MIVNVSEAKDGVYGEFNRWMAPNMVWDTSQRECDKDPEVWRAWKIRSFDMEFDTVVERVLFNKV